MERTERLMELAAKSVIELSSAAADSLCQYLSLLLKANETMNLTAITDWDEAVEKHLLDCLVASALPEIAGRVADVGAGAGFPAAVIKAYRPDCEVTAIDSTGKKLDFVKAASESCKIPCITAHIRAEDAGRDPLFRAKFDTVTARAVAALPALCEYCLPLVKRGGHFIAMKGPGAADEIAAAQNAIKKLGGELLRTRPFTLPDGSQRINIIIKKVADTPREYPRKQKDIKNKPI